MHVWSISTASTASTASISNSFNSLQQLPRFLGTPIFCMLIEKFAFYILEIKSKVLHMLGMCFTIELHPQGKSLSTTGPSAVAYTC